MGGRGVAVVMAKVKGGDGGLINWFLSSPILGSWLLALGIHVCSAS
jgi:hypothetical protein